MFQSWSPGGCVGRLLVYALVAAVLAGGLSMGLENVTKVAQMGHLPGPVSIMTPSPVRSGSVMVPAAVRSGAAMTPVLTPEPSRTAVHTMTPAGADQVASELKGALDTIISLGLRFVLAGGAVGLALVAVIIPARFALSPYLVRDVLSLVQSFTGNWEPEPVSAPAPVREKSADLSRLADLGELTDFCRSALVADSWAYGQMRGVGWSGGAQRWQELIDQVAKEGFAVKVSSNGGQGWSWIAKGARGHHEALAHYAGQYLQVGP